VVSFVLPLLLPFLQQASMLRRWMCHRAATGFGVSTHCSSAGYRCK